MLLWNLNQNPTGLSRYRFSATEGFVPLSLSAAVELLLILLEVKLAILLEAGTAISRKHNEIYYFFN